jgi:hypothetical protein
VIPRILVAGAALCCAIPASALLIRPDRDDAEYLELASRYGSSVALNATGGEGVLIAPRWVLTSAQAGKSLRDAKPPAPIAFGSRRHEVQAVVVHPDWQAGSESDIALVYLKEPVPGIEPSRLYREADEAGKGVVIAASGPTGRIGDKAPLKTDGKRRASINTVDAVTPTTFELRIKVADDASDLQGAATPAEIGWPAYIEKGGEILVAGIGSTTDGMRERYARVSAFVPWIEATMLEKAKQEAEALLGAN